MLLELHPVPTIHNGSKFNPSVLGTPTLPRESPRKRKIGVDELVFFQATDKIVDTDKIVQYSDRIHMKTSPLKDLITACKYSI